MNMQNLTPQQRKNKIDLLFQKIAFIAESIKDISTRDKLIKPLSEELWTITKKQLELGELSHLHKGE